MSKGKILLHASPNASSGEAAPGGVVTSLGLVRIYREGEWRVGMEDEEERRAGVDIMVHSRKLLHSNLYCFFSSFCYKDLPRSKSEVMTMNETYI